MALNRQDIQSNPDVLAALKRRGMLAESEGSPGLPGDPATGGAVTPTAGGPPIDSFAEQELEQGMIDTGGAIVQDASEDPEESVVMALSEWLRRKRKNVQSA